MAGSEVVDPAGPSAPADDADASPDGGEPTLDPGLQEPPCSGLALRLDGSNFASIPRVVEDDFTLEAWIQTAESRSGGSAFYGLFIFDADVPGSGGNDDFASSVLDDRLAFTVGNPDTTVQGSTPVSTNQWIHVALTRSRSTGELKLLINGVVDATVVAPNRAALAASMALAIGGNAAGRNFVGLIDEVKIWNVVRTTEQVASNLRQRPSGSEQGLVGYYGFEDRGTEETADGSPLGIAATFTGVPDYAPSSVLCPPEQAP